jgi:hypothetical protein
MFPPTRTPPPPHTHTTHRPCVHVSAVPLRVGLSTWVDVLAGGMILDGGTESGVMAMVGSALRFTPPKAVRVIGVSPKGLSTLPNQAPHPDCTPLEPHHTNFVLVPSNEVRGARAAGGGKGGGVYVWEVGGGHQVCGVGGGEHWWLRYRGATHRCWARGPALSQAQQKELMSVFLER